MISIKSLVKAINLLLLLFVATVIQASSSHPVLDRLLSSNEEPDGVVMEVVSWDPNAWQWVAPMISDFRQQLNQRFPGIDIAVVSHGGEQFQLTKTNLAKAPAVYDGLAALSDQGVDFHVCGTHSEWNGVDESAYVDLVDVSPSGPAQINDYKKLGYELIVIRGPGN